MLFRSPGALFSKATEAGAQIAAAERRELGRIEQAAWYQRFAYVQADEGYFDLVDRREVTRSAFNALFRHIACHSVHAGANGKARRIEASIAFDENRQTNGARALVGVTYAAGDGVIVARDGDLYGNRWRDARPPVDRKLEADINPWLAHVEALVPEKREREHLDRKSTRLNSSHSSVSRMPSSA